MVTPSELADRIIDVWREREGVSPPGRLPALPEMWPSRYRRIASDVDLEDRSYDEAVILVETLWQQMFPEQAR